MEGIMQFMAALFGGSDNAVLNSALALGIVLVLIVLGVWVLKQFTRVSSTMARGTRQRRLKVIDSLMIDPKRQLMIVRRDGVEHLILTGGPTDIVVETGIPVTEAQAAQRPAATRPPAPENKPEPAEPVEPHDIVTPAPVVPGVSRAAIDRLRDLAHPEPLKPRGSLRHTGLLRPVTQQEPGIIPMLPELRSENSSGASLDSAKSPLTNGTSGQTRLGGGANRFFEGDTPSDRV
jgi:flagellar biogenesis protein FliO